MTTHLHVRCRSRLPFAARRGAGDGRLAWCFVMFAGMRPRLSPLTFPQRRAWHSEATQGRVRPSPVTTTLVEENPADGHWCPRGRTPPSDFLAEFLPAEVSGPSQCRRVQVGRCTPRGAGGRPGVWPWGRPLGSAVCAFASLGSLKTRGGGGGSTTPAHADAQAGGRSQSGPRARQPPAAPGLRCPASEMACWGGTRMCRPRGHVGSQSRLSTDSATSLLSVPSSQTPCPEGAGRPGCRESNVFQNPQGRRKTW